MKLYIETLGCTKNANDSEVAAGILESAGHTIITNPEEADVIIVNTCGFINDAKKESISRIFDMTACKKEEGILIVAGCLSQRYSKELYDEMPEVDIFIGVNDYPVLPEILKNHIAGKRERHLGTCKKEFIETGRRKRMEPSYSASIKIAEGCNNICSYCIIPSIRGPYRSRRMEDIINEAEGLAATGCKELILIAQDVTAYGRDIYGDLRLPDLIRKLCKIEGILWIRLMYCYEDLITDDLIRVMAEEEKVCHYIDIPIQHVSDKILKSMNRRSTQTSIKDTLSRLRMAIPDIHIRTTLITGFPGEDNNDFAELVDFVEQEKFDRLGVFAYSKEEGTPAALMKNQVREDIKERRKEIIMEKQLEISLNANIKKIGQLLDVMVEEIEDGGSYIGRSRYDAPEIDNSVLFTSDRQLAPGDIASVRIIDAFDYDLVGMEEYHESAE
ncbi:MAG: 30S ribosomal protein S12 methylthiotransferase RimO [Eubacteriales bacterium]|nr:30S ribosomal protein S12 methylthiotransferase RimO [Eubacteriales bacterium]MDD4121498.1 30S ribosomal protein S12 methylthiotransferase RimO [Eubacteriales bacterium]MDD4630513.1 30S ribosomal protein S12 methylthiotransferase RimO [Eubacteriales bacterium]